MIESLRSVVLDVSVIIPCHDLGEFIDECVKSVVAQDVSGLEIIVVDDGSTDPYTLEVLNLLPAKYRGVSVVRTEHCNVGLARNAGFAQSSGDFVLFLDCDDMLGERFLRATLDGLKQHPDHGVAFTDIELFGQVTGTWYTGPLLFASELYFENYLQYCSLIRRSVIEANGGFSSNVPSYADWDLWIKLHKNGVRFLKVPGVYAWYRKRENSMLARDQSKRPYLINRLVLNHKELYGRLFLCPINNGEERRVRELLRAAVENPHDGAITKLRDTRLYRQFISYSVVVRAYRKVWTCVMHGKS